MLGLCELQAGMKKAWQTSQPLLGIYLPHDFATGQNVYRFNLMASL